MAKRKRSEELLVRTATLSSACPTVTIRASEPRAAPPLITGDHWLIFRGTLDEPVKNVSEIEFTLRSEEHPEPGPRKPAPVGAVIGMRPHMTVYVRVPHVEFEHLWMRADLIKHAYLAFTKPRYGSALVTSVVFSSEPIE